MAHFVRLNQDSIVTEVIIVANQELIDQGGNESEAVGIAFCQQLFGADTRWVQTSYNARIRKNYAGIGYTYDAVNDNFIAPQPYLSWTLDSNDQWQPPVPQPQAPPQTHWNEELQKWVVL
jgi:hypothetical protein